LEAAAGLGLGAILKSEAYEPPAPSPLPLGDYTPMTEDQILKRLLALNLERATP